jgi:hypothetical protein
MKINCLSCGHTIDLDENYCDYEGQVKCYTCSALLEIRLEESLIKSVKFPELLRSADNGIGHGMTFSQNDGQ